MITYERLKELLSYNPETGVFIWKISPMYKIKIGDIAGGATLSRGYKRIGIDGKRYRTSRLAFLYMKGYFPEYQVDHIDRKRNNDRWNNLRHVSPSCNTRNSKIRNTNNSGITGICWHKQAKKWMAEIRIFKKSKYLGLFDNLLEAARSRWEAEVKYGWPDCNTTSSAYLYLQKYKGL